MLIYDSLFAVFVSTKIIGNRKILFGNSVYFDPGMKITDLSTSAVC